MNLETSEWTRHGSIEHRYWKQTIAIRLRGLGYTVQEEYPIGQGKAVDLVASRNGAKIAIEIETGKSDAVANIQKCLDAGFDLILSVATNSNAKKAVERQVASISDQRQRVKVLAVRDVLEAEELI